MKGRHYFILLLLYALSNVPALAQSCGETLNKARDSFSAGHFYEIPALLKPCLDNGFNKDQKIEAYWLLTRTYLFIDDPISAEDSYLKLLKQDPEYEIDPERDPVDVVYLSKKFKTTPIFILYGKVGSNYSSISVINNYGTDNTSSTMEEYSGKFGFKIGGGAELNLSDHVSLGTELNLYSRAYKYTNGFFNADSQTFEETQLGFEWPVHFKYRWSIGRSQPYFYIGGGLNYLVSANATVKLVDRIGSDTSNPTEIPVTGPQINIKDLRNTLTHFTHIGAGVNYRVGYNYLIFDVRYTAGLSNMVNPDSQYSNPVLLYKFGFVDDDKLMNSMAISVGFVKPLYKARKIKKPTVKGMVSKLRKKNGK